jgi:MFS family permease
MGLGGAFMVVYFNPIVLQFFKAEERSTINGINAVAFNIGTAVILWQMGTINDLTGGWQNSLAWFSVISLIVALLWLLVKFEEPDTSTQNINDLPAVYSYKEGLKDRFNWVYGLAYSGILAFYICLFTFYPKAGIVQSKWVIGFGIIGTIFGIIYAKKIPLRIPVIRWSGFVIIISTGIFSFSDIYWLQTFAAMVLGFFIFLPVTALVSIPHELPKMTSPRITIVFSMFYSISYIISTLILWIFGSLVDINQGDFTWSFILITALSSTLFIGSYFLPESGQQKNIKVGS